MQALLDGKKIKGTAAEWVALDDFGRLVSGCGVHLSHLCVEGDLYIEPNRHKPGTFAWAREELARGNAVERCRSARKLNPVLVSSLDHYGLSLNDIDATDWAHAK